ncbi:hypothetical protein Hanom_Chr16g01490161 [Helianthus anomalus]
MVVFTAKHGDLLEKIFVASGSHGTMASRQVDVSKITPPTSPPSRTFGLSPSPVGHGKRKEDDVKIEQVGEGGAAGAGGDAGGAGGDGRGKGVDTEAESSEATPRHTIYTRRPPGSVGGATSGVPRSPEYENIQAGSRDTHNPACADLPHAPQWNLTQGSRMSDHDNCREFFSLSLPLAERLFQKRRNRFYLLDDHIHVGVNFFATSQEIVREWRLMGRILLNSKMRKRNLLKRRRNLMLRRRAYPGGLLMWSKSSHRRNNLTPISKRNRRSLVSGQIRSCKPNVMRLEQEYLQRIAKLEKFAEEKIAESKASELLAEEVSADCKWLLACAVPLGQAVYNSGWKNGYGEGRAAAANNEKDYHFELYKEDCGAAYAAKRREYEFIEFGIVKAVDKLSRRANTIEVLKKALGDLGTDGGTGPSHQD